MARTKLIILIILVCFAMSSMAQDPFAKQDIHKYIKIDQITGIQIYNANNGKTWMINNSSLNRVKTILAESYVARYVALKPGHLSIKFFGKNDFHQFDTYMYYNTICFDPNYGVNEKLCFSIILAKPIYWEKLK